jgi:hypothetical protein
VMFFAACECRLSASELQKIGQERRASGRENTIKKYDSIIKRFEVKHCLISIQFVGALACTGHGSQNRCIAFAVVFTPR